jgi:uncharacterized protein (TIGR02246 family)
VTRPSILLAGFGLLLAGTGCQPSTQELPSLSEADIAAIEAFHENWLEAERANDWEGVAALMADGAVIMPMGHPALDGPSGYLDYVAPLVEDFGVVVTDFIGTIEEIDGRGDLAYVRSTWSHTYTMDGVPEPTTEVGKQLVVLRKQADGSWLATEWIWNSDGPSRQAESGG